uniref:Secreted protein n=1 Tax=Anguilla anguilla TaxID=7936 RepID=A0A0E9XMZ4_ANGAN
MSGMNLFKMLLAESTILFAIWGETRTEYAVPRMRLILPGSVSWTGRMVLRTGQEKCTSPPPPGGIPLFTIFSSRPSPSSPNFFIKGTELAFNASTDGSIWSLVTPLRTARSGPFMNGASIRRASR